MTCPACGLENLASARYCDCGQSLAHTGVTKGFPRTFTAGHVLQAWGIGAAFVMTEGVVSLFLPIPGLWWYSPPAFAFFGLSDGPVVGLVFYSVVFGVVAFGVLDWLYWRPAVRGRKSGAQYAAPSAEES